MSHEQKQVFLTSSPTRWQRLKWTFRVIICILALLTIILAVALVKVSNPAIPQLKTDNSAYKAIIDNGRNAAVSAIEQKETGFSKYISAHGDALKRIKYVNKADSLHLMPAALRAAFYDATDEQSYFSLKNNVNKLNMLLPLWMTIDSSADTIIVNTDIRGADIIKGSGVPVVAVISNFSGTDFNGAPLHRILNDQSKKEQLINGIIKVIQANKFAGINIDFEELQESSDEPIIDFMRQLYTRVHALHLIVTQDVSPFNSDFNLKELSKYNDYIFLMAYDEYNSNSNPGPVCAQNYIEAAMDEALRQMDSSKLVLAIAGYGYDWPKGKTGTDVSYSEALSIAGESEGRVKFDTATYNLSYTYSDENNLEHSVFFTDAATNFNTLRYAIENGVAGVALWRLGQEDSRLWTFYNKDLNDDAVDSFNYSILNHVNASNDVDYIGEGEILDVISTPKPGTIRTVVDRANDIVNNETYESLPSIFVIKKLLICFG